MKYPVECKVCKKVMAENEDQLDNLLVEPVYSENLSGYICEDCKQDLYWCSSCDDWAYELEGRHGEQVCPSCASAIDIEDTNRHEAANLLRRAL